MKLDDIEMGSLIEGRSKEIYLLLEKGPVYFIAKYITCLGRPLNKNFGEIVELNNHEDWVVCNDLKAEIL